MEAIGDWSSLYVRFEQILVLAWLLLPPLEMAVSSGSGSSREPNIPPLYQIMGGVGCGRVDTDSLTLSMLRKPTPTCALGLQTDSVDLNRLPCMNDMIYRSRRGARCYSLRCARLRACNIANPTR